MYAQLFDEAADEAEFSAFLVSPTRQAVALARTYNSKERKLQINSTSRADDMYEDDEPEESPAFVQVIEQIRENAGRQGLLSKKRETRSVWSGAEACTREAPDAAPVQEQARRAEAPKRKEKAPETDAPSEITYVEQDEEEFTFDDFSFTDEEDGAHGKPESSVMPDLRSEFGRDGYGRRRMRADEEEPERKIIVPLAVLYALIAVPVTVLLACVILIPTFASLGVSAMCLYAGFKVTLAAFAGFSMFSDIMVVLGSGVIILALGLLFLWLFIWFIGSVIAGLINAVIQLGGKWCSKEVR